MSTEPKYPVWYDRVEWRALAPHLQRRNGGTESLVSRLFCHRTFALEMTPNMKLDQYSEYELRILAQMSKQKHRRP